MANRNQGAEKSLNTELSVALNLAQTFRAGLSKRSDFKITQTFDSLRSAIKPTLAALIIANGASGCSTLSSQVLDSGDFAGQYAYKVAEAAEIESLSPSQRQSVTDYRLQSSQYSHLERVTPEELSQRLLDAGMETREVLKRPLVIDNPFQPGKLIRVSSNQDLSANWDLISKHGMGSLTDVVSLRSVQTPFAFNSNSATSANRGLKEASLPSFIVLPKIMTEGSWAPNNHAKALENILFTIYHELAHTTFAQETNLYGGINPVDQSVTDAHGNTYKILNENHADVVAAIATMKAFELPGETFVARLHEKIALEKQKLKSIGLNGAPIYGQDRLTDYRPGKSFEVLAEIASTNPDFLKNLKYSVIPEVANSIVKQAGYTYSTPELIAETTLAASAATIGSPSLRNMQTDIALVGDISTHLPDGPETALSKDAANKLFSVWHTAMARQHIDDLANGLAAFQVFADSTIKRSTLNRSSKASQQLTSYPEIREGLTELIAEIAEEQNNGLTPERAGELQHRIETIARGIPTQQELRQKREDLINLIAEEMTSLTLSASESDPTHTIAAGNNQSVQRISVNIQNTYGNQVWFDHIGDQYTAPTISQTSVHLDDQLLTHSF